MTNKDILMKMIGDREENILDLEEPEDEKEHIIRKFKFTNGYSTVVARGVFTYGINDDLFTMDISDGKTSWYDCEHSVKIYCETWEDVLKIIKIIAAL